MTALQEFILDCENNPNFETCGLLLSNNTYYACKNIALNQEKEFTIDPIDYVKASSIGKIVCVLHSHTIFPERPSEQDIISCNSGKIPWIIYSILTKKLFLLNPEIYSVPLISREYVYGVFDCWTLVKDTYKQELGIDLIYYIDPDFEWYKNGKNYFEELIEEANFIEVKDNSIKKYDVILMQAPRSPVINHTGVYYGNNIILHHVIDSLSCREPYSGFWQKITKKRLRYKGL